MAKKREILRAEAKSGDGADYSDLQLRPNSSQARLLPSSPELTVSACLEAALASAQFEAPPGAEVRFQITVEARW